MGSACSCYKEPSIETKVELGQPKEQSNGVPPMHNMVSVPSSSSPVNTAYIKNGQSADTTRQRLISFYKIHNPSKLNDTSSFEEVLRRYKGRETELFDNLHKKYVTNTRKETDTRKETLTDTTILEHVEQSGDANHGSMDAYDESSPLTSGNDGNIAEIDDMNRKISTHNDTNTNTNTQPKSVGLNKDLFKIQVTKPSKKKAKGTNLFGGGDMAKKKEIPMRKPDFTSNSSQSQSHSTSFIAATLSSPNFGKTNSDGLPHFGNSITRSNTLTLGSSDKNKLDQRRQSSLAVRRNQNRRNLPIRINKVWSTFAQYVIDKMIDEKEKESVNNLKNDQLLKIDETPEVTPEPTPRSMGSSVDNDNENGNENDILDEIINRNRDDKNKKNNKKNKDEYFEEDVPTNDRKKGHESLEVLQIDPRLFTDAKSRSSTSARSSSDSTLSNDSNISSTTESDSLIDVYAIEITYSQFNIVLNNNSVEVSPDMSAALIWLLLDMNGTIDAEVKGLGLDSDNFHNNSMKERGFHNKQFKKIIKCKISYSMIENLMKRIANSGVVTRQDKSLHPKHLSYEKRNYVIWDKIFEHLINKTSFNVEEEYLYGALSQSELSDPDKIINMLSSLNSHWQHRVQLMEYIDDKLNGGSDMERDIYFASTLSTNHNFIPILNGWACQLTDDRSGVARTAVTLLPTVVATITTCMKFPALIFEQESVINPIYNGIFTLVKNRRLKDMADDAYEALIQITDILGNIATVLADYTLMTILVEMLENHTNPKIERHDKARESCIGGIGFLLYGAEQQDTNDLNLTVSQPSGPMHSVIVTPIGQLSKSNDEIKMPDIADLSDMAEAKQGSKLSKIMQREYLLKNEAFVTAFGNILKHGVTDKSESGRRKSFKLLQRLETEKDGQLLQDLLTKWDFTVQKKYKTWKKMNERKKNSSVKNGRKYRGRNRKGSKKSKKKKSQLKNQVKKKIENQNTAANENNDTNPSVTV